MKNGKKVLFYLDKFTIKIIKIFSKQNDMSMSEFIDWLVLNYYHISDPRRELELLEKKEKELIDKITEIKKKKDILYNKIKSKEEYDKKIKQQREQLLNKALDIIVNKFLKGDSKDKIERIIHFWSLRLNMDFDELSFRAKKRLDEVFKNVNR